MLSYIKPETVHWKQNFAPWLIGSACNNQYVLGIGNKPMHTTIKDFYVISWQREVLPQSDFRHDAKVDRKQPLYDLVGDECASVVMRLLHIVG